MEQELTKEEVKRILSDKFVGSKSYLGSQVIHTIHSTSFKIKNETGILNVEDIKKGDCFWLYESGKPRPAVVINFNKKTHICQIIKLTSTENLRNTGILVNSRFTKECFYSYGFDIAMGESVSKNFFFHVEDKKNLNLAIKENKIFFGIK